MKLIGEAPRGFVWVEIDGRAELVFGRTLKGTDKVIRCSYDGCTAQAKYMDPFWSNVDEWTLCEKHLRGGR